MSFSFILTDGKWAPLFPFFSFIWRCSPSVMKEKDHGIENSIKRKNKEKEFSLIPWSFIFISFGISAGSSFSLTFNIMPALMIPNYENESFPSTEDNKKKNKRTIIWLHQQSIVLFFLIFGIWKEREIKIVFLKKAFSHSST